MRRVTVVGTRMITFVLALALLALAVFCFCWWSGELFDLPDELTVAWARSIDDKSWYPWAVGIGGLVLCLISLRSLIAQFRQYRVDQLRVPSSEVGTSLRLDLDAVLGAARDSLEGSLGIRGAHAKAVREQGELMCSFDVKVDPDADLAQVARECDNVVGDLRQCVGKEDLRCRTLLSAASRKSSMPRVR